MSGKRYPEEFKIEAVKQVTEKGYSVAEVATRLGMTTHSLYAWIKRYDQGQSKATKDKDSSVELARLKKELQRVTEERDILNEEGEPKHCFAPTQGESYARVGAAVYFASQSK